MDIIIKCKNGFNTIFKKTLFIISKSLTFHLLLYIFIILLNVSPLFAGNAFLQWEAPSTNDDGTPLTDLAGYKIYYGTASGNYTQTIDVGNVTTYTITNLTDGVSILFCCNSI